MNTKILTVIILILISSPVFAQDHHNQLKLNDSDYFEKPGLNVLAFNNWYNGLFSDSKMSGIEIIHHERRTVTNGDVRLNPTPEQWDPIPQFKERKVNKSNNSVDAYLSYPDYNFNYLIKTQAKDGGFYVSVHLEEPLPETLEGRAGLNLEFLPSAYFENSYLMDGKSGVFPLYPSGPMEVRDDGTVNPMPLAKGIKLSLSPEDPKTHITIKSLSNELLLYDGRNKAQNGWFVVRTMIPSGQSGKVVEWFVKANTISNWIKQPMIAYSQVGYHPAQNKMAVIELDKNDEPAGRAALIKILENGESEEKYVGEVSSWGKYLRYDYLKFDFSHIQDEGLYAIEYDGIRTGPFRIAKNVYKKAWHPTLDIFFPVQMDHMLVNEAYRVWHGASHLDDALQAPVNHVHFDLYAQGSTTDTPYQPGEHIPGLNFGGWYDAGDYDIRTQTQYATVLSLVHAWEAFGINRDETTVDYDRLFVDLHVPDGKPDILQQIEHGTRGLIAQHRAVGHAIPGIVAAHISQYTHLGDGLTKTDNLIYEPTMDSLQTDGFKSGIFDDRWAFTSKSTALNFGSIAALAAASRALKGFNQKLADECISVALKTWNEEQSKEPDIFRHGNTTGGNLTDEEFKAAVQLLITTQEQRFADKIQQLWPSVAERFAYNVEMAVMAIPYMDELYRENLQTKAIALKKQLHEYEKLNPFGVPISTGGWAGNGSIIRLAINSYLLHKVFPKIVDAEMVFTCLNYIFGCHPGSNVSFVSGVGTNSKKVAYGMNRADFSFIAGGVVPGVLILPPDFPENKEDWPFLWGENEYVVNMGAIYIFAVNAAIDLLN